MELIYEFLRKNYILAICEDAIGSNAAATLNLSRFEMSVVPELLQRCDNISKLFLNNNRLRTLSTSLSSTHLQVLTLDYNELNEFPLCICCLAHLRTLNVSCNRIASLPPAIGKLKQMETFWCNNNQLQELPAEIGQCERLETLGMRGNHLKQIPETLGQLHRLRWLTLESNMLSTLPTTFAALQQLVHLNMKNNELTQLPGCLSAMRRLRFVFLNCNRIATMPQHDELEQTSFMQMLNLSANPMCYMTEAKDYFKPHRHVYYECTLHHNNDRNINDDDDNDNDENDDGISDWENSIRTSDLDSTDESMSEYDFEATSELIPVISRYATNF